jgi:polyhydroxybutyrate depolymerase
MPSPSDAAGPTIDVEITVDVGGRKRLAVACVPDVSPPAAGWPVVLAFHGGQSYPEQMRGFSGLDEFAAAGAAVVVYPAGTGSREGILTWNGGNCCGEAFQSASDDVGFVDALLNRLLERLQVDPRRCHATGMSNGAMMAYRVAAELAERIASIAPVAGPLALATISPARPVPVLHFHGSLDQFTPLEGGVGRRSVTRTCHRGIVDGLLDWVRANRLDPEPVRTAIPSVEDGISIERIAWGRPDEAEVVLYRIEGAGHTWPGRVPDSFYLGTSALGFPANPLILDFFRRHPLAD